MIGAVKSGATWSQRQVMDPEARKQNKETISTNLGIGAAATKKAVSSGAQSAKDGAKYAGGKIYAGSAAAGSAVKSKLDETGVSEAAKKAAISVATNAKYAGTVVNQKIEANPTLSNMKRQTTQKMGLAAAYVGNLVGWGRSNAAAGEENKEENKEEGKEEGTEEGKEEGKEEEGKEEGKDEGNEIVEESKEQT